ncbi:indole-3-glycerol phosphate synthase TrpC [Clostridium cochlearium]|uniref:indole-3-glycerol phosphate synthase TrpC n=1 Tax=Clostridium cochlearium TaxID=1494 RepID=UPI0017C6091C|nr:indole-3-glycerol phosphate synthase TrpC [Clostridium cochlearium]NMA58503.1 indole-3-glycerol phosphate synthase TrpC [Clostridium cochlearium]
MFLDKIVNKKKIQIEEEKKQLSYSEVLENIEKYEYNHRDFKKALNKEKISIIGEIKKASPSKGVILKDFNPINIAEVYEKINIDAISVLTEKYFFQGDDSYANEVKKVTTKPIFRKDFIVDLYQIYTSKLIGADAILLIAGVLKENLGEFYLKTKEIGLQCIVEVHNKEELNNALEVDADIIGINNRNLIDFNVSLDNTEKLIKYIPKNKTIVSESGIKTPEEIKYLRNLGVNAVLIGESFMREINNLDTLENFIYKAKGGM